MIGQGSSGSSGEGVDDIQQSRILLLRNLRPKHFVSPDGDSLQTTVRAWFRAAEDENGPLSEERELVDWSYQIDGGMHHMWIWYAE
jgi:hypothetical protein